MHKQRDIQTTIGKCKSIDTVGNKLTIESDWNNEGGKTC